VSTPSFCFQCLLNCCLVPCMQFGPT
jgi:hypothetical protein